MQWDFLENKAKQLRSVSEHDMGGTVEPVSLLEESERCRGGASDIALAEWANEVPTLELLAVDVDQLPTQVGFPAITLSPTWSFPVTDGILIYDQLTWLLPVIPGSATVSIQSSPS